MSKMDDLIERQLEALNLIISQKQKVAKVYNRKVKTKSFHEGELVWKVILLIGTKDPRLSKWSPTWEGPFLVSEVLDDNPYRLM